MRKMILTAAAAMTVFTMMTGCQAKPAGDNGQTTQATVEQTTEEQTTTAAKEISLDEIHAAVKEAYGENYIPSAAFDEQGMKELFGINSDLYDSFIAEGPMISVHVDTFVAVKAKEGKGEEVAQHLNDYRDSQLNGAMQYPMNLPKIEASQVVRHGDYVFFVMLGTPSEEAEVQGEEAALESAKENTQIAIDIIDGFFAS
ncbi:MAG: DUF4358 domain-containing protein [Hungatella hathewayi]|nr:DUF4358 domain-containing protein [Hungatella hathewayi]